MNGTGQLYDLLDNVNDLIQSVAPDGAMLYVNRTWRETLGYSPAEIAGLNVLDVIHPDCRAQCMELFGRVMCGETVNAIEAVFVTKAGRRIVVEGNADCQMCDGQPVATRAIFRNVTERRQQEETLQRREQELRTLLEHSPDVVSRFDSNLRYIYINSAIETVTGLGPQTFLGKTNAEIGMPQPLVVAWEAKLRTVFATAASETVEFEFPTLQGARHFDSILIPELDGDNCVASVLVLSRDITERKHMEQALRESEVRFQAFMDNSPMVAYIRGKDHRLAYANQHFLRQFDKSAEQLLNTTEYDLFPPDVAARLQEEMCAVLQNDVPVCYEETVPTGDGKSDTWLSFKFPLRDGRGCEFMGGISIDVSERKYYERQLEAYQRRLEETIAELERLASTDALTGVHNKGAFIRCFDEEVVRANRYRLPLSLLLLDVDKFKDYNDTFGHPAGDEVLQHVAQLIKEHARANDFIARVGGEEFAIVLPNTPIQGAFIVAERLRRGVESARWTKRRVTLSIGVAELSSIYADSASITQAADQALYQAKRTGRNQVAKAGQIHAKQLTVLCNEGYSASACVKLPAHLAPPACTQRQFAMAATPTLEAAITARPVGSR